jgi:hypothetical protein
MSDTSSYFHAIAGGTVNSMKCVQLDDGKYTINIHNKCIQNEH